MSRLQRKFRDRILCVKFQDSRKGLENYKIFRTRSPLRLAGREYSSLIWKSSQDIKVDYFFATDGPNLESFTIEQVQDWICDVSEIATPAKAAARLSLALSKSFPALFLCQGKVHEVKTDREDIKSISHELSRLSVSSQLEVENPNKKEDESIASPLDVYSVRLIPDEFSNAGLIMTDGCGIISSDIAGRMWSSLAVHFPDCRNRPDVFQVRLVHSLGIFKGLLITNNMLPSRTILLRPSMRKAAGPLVTSPLFNPLLDYEIAVCSFNYQKYSYEDRIRNFNEISDIQQGLCYHGQLNRQLISVLSACGGPEMDTVLLRLQKEAIERIIAEASNWKTATDVIIKSYKSQLRAIAAKKSRAEPEAHLMGSDEEENVFYDSDDSDSDSDIGDPNETNSGILLHMYCAGFSLTEPWVRLKLSELVKKRVAKLQSSCRLPCPGSAWLIAAPDPYALSGMLDHTVSPSLQEGCVFVKVDGQTITGPVCIGRNPALLPGDIRKLVAVSCPRLEHLDNVVVFSVCGPRSPLDCMSGGDYDGDRVLVIFNRQVVDLFQEQPAAAPDSRLIAAPVSQIGGGQTPRRDEVKFRKEVRAAFTDVFLDFDVGILTNLHSSFICSGPQKLFHPYARALAVAAASALDRAKHGNGQTDPDLIEARRSAQELGTPHWRALAAGRGSGATKFFMCKTIEGVLYDHCLLPDEEVSATSATAMDVGLNQPPHHGSLWTGGSYPNTNNLNEAQPPQVLERHETEHVIPLDCDLLLGGREKYTRDAERIILEWKSVSSGASHEANIFLFIYIIGNIQACTNSREA